MERHALIAMLLGAVGLLVAALAPPGGAAAQPQPTLTVSPSTGPCDALLEVSGQGFAPGSVVLIAIGEPTTDAALDILASAVADGSGYFARKVSLGSIGCVAARLTEEFAPGSIELRITAKPPYEPGSPPPADARAAYLFTTSEISRPEPTLVLVPDTGPCDARVTLEATGFEPSYEMLLRLMKPHSGVSLGPLVEGLTDGDGVLRIPLTLGALGCEGAALDVQVEPPRGRLSICARTGGWGKCASYWYTTITAGAAAAPSELPATGDGAAGSGTGRLPLVVPLGLGGAGLLLLLLAVLARPKVR